MKISSIVALLAVISPCVSAIRGDKKDKTEYYRRQLKGDDDKDDGDDGIGIPDIDDIIDAAGGACFSESSVVQVLHKGATAMKDLQVGDQVLTTDSYQSIYAFGHKALDISAEFIQFTTANNDQKLEMTKEHLVFLQNSENPVRADSIKVGDVLRGESAPAEVTKLESVQKRGLYAPLTKAGTLVVDGIVASSYISLQSTAPEYFQLEGASMGISQHKCVHMLLSPFRMMCQMMECDSYNNHGMPHYVAIGLSGIDAAQSLPLLVQIVVFAALLLFLSACMVVENSMGLPLLAGAAYAAMKFSGVSTRKVKTV